MKFFTLTILFIIFTLNSFATLTFLASQTYPSSTFSWSKFVTSFAKFLSGVFSGYSISTKNIVFIAKNLKMVWVATSTILTSMVNDKFLSVPIFRKLTKSPKEKNSMNMPWSSSEVDSSIPFIKLSRPVPATSLLVNGNVWENAFSLLWCNHSEIIPHYLTISNQ